MDDENGEPMLNWEGYGGFDLILLLEYTNFAFYNTKVLF